MKKKVLFISSTGGHLNELLQLKSLFSNYDYLLVTEKDKSTISLKDKYNVKYLFLILLNLLLYSLSLNQM